MTHGDGKHRSAMDVLAMPDISLDDVITVITKLENQANEELSKFQVNSMYMIPSKLHVSTPNT